MGSLLHHGRILRAFQLGVLSLFVCFQVGCETKRNPGGISAAQFVAPQKAADGLRALTTELDLRIAAGIPDTLAGSNVLTLRVVGGNRLAIFINAGNSIVSVGLCPECSDSTSRSDVQLHYDRRGFEEELGRHVPGVVGALIQVSSFVPAMRLRNGWVLFYETSTESLVAVRHDPNFRPMTNDASQNKGRGNGLILSSVIQRQEIAAQLLGDPEAQVPQITRLHELADGRVLVIFQSAATQLEDVYVLDLSFEQEVLDVDFDEPTGASIQAVDMLRGTFRQPGAVFVGEDLMKQAANPNQIPGAATELVIDEFQPVSIPTDGSVLLFDTASSSFLKASNDAGAETVTRIVTAVDLVMAVGAPAPYRIGTSWMHPTRTELVFVEEQNDVILGLDYEANTLRVVADNNTVKSPRDPRLAAGTIIAPGGELPVFLGSENDIRENRLLFDTSRDQLLSLNYEAGQLVVTTKAVDYFEVNSNTIAEYSFIFSFGSDGGTEHLRVWDSASFSLYELRLGYTTLPVVTR